MPESQQIAFLGLGHMGLPMCQNLVDAHVELKAWNRSPRSADELGGVAAHVVASIDDALRDADLIISMLSDGAALLSLINNPALQDQLKQGSIWIDMSSTKPAEAVAAAQVLADHQVGFVDAPVSGGTHGAAAASLAIMAGAEAEEFNTVLPVLDHLGRAVHVGAVGSGQLAKLANQMIVGNTIAAVAEAMLLLEAGGANPDAVRQALRGGFADSTILQQHGQRMSERNFRPGAYASLQLKDMDNALEKANALDLTLPMTTAVATRYRRYIDELDGAQRDHAGLFEELLNLNQHVAKSAKGQHHDPI